MLGTGIGQIIFILFIMLIVAGPKRMMQWAYVLGKYVAKFRGIYAETITTINKELQSTGLELPKDPAMLRPRAFDVLNEASKVLSGAVTQATSTLTATPDPAAPAPTQSPTPTTPQVTAPAAPEPAENTSSTTPAASTPSLTVSSEPENANGDQKKYDAWTPKE